MKRKRRQPDIWDKFDPIFQWIGERIEGKRTWLGLRVMSRYETMWSFAKVHLRATRPILGGRGLIGVLRFAYMRVEQEFKDWWMGHDAAMKEQSDRLKLALARFSRKHGLSE